MGWQGFGKYEPATDITLTLALSLKGEGINRHLPVRHIQLETVLACIVPNVGIQRNTNSC